jgi:L-ribulose-5-phosphate 4-epimerase
MLEDLKEAVLKANLALPRHGLCILTWGNVSGLDRGRGLMVIKPSGMPYDEIRVEDLAVVDLDAGRQVEGDRKPSSDTPTHLVLYRAFDGISSVVHTHSAHATVWAQAGLDIPALGTTHADYFHGPVPCARALAADEIAGDYEAATGEVIVETFRERGVDPLAVPGSLVRFHGPFAWGGSPAEAVERAVVLEEVAKLALWGRALAPDAPSVPKNLLDRHYLRKHGAGAYYGQ